MPYGLYPPMPRSPITYLSDGIDASITTISVDDISKLPVAPNIATIGDGENSETIKYGGKSGSNLTSVVRGFEGAAREWNKGVPIANVPCAQHITSLQTALDAAEKTANKGVAGGYAGLNAQGKVPAEQVSIPADVMTRGADQTMTARLIAQNNTAYTTKQVRNITLSTANPSGGANGDIWIKYV